MMLPFGAVHRCSYEAYDGAFGGSASQEGIMQIRWMCGTFVLLLGPQGEHDIEDHIIQYNTPFKKTNILNISNTYIKQYKCI